MLDDYLQSVTNIAQYAINGYEVDAVDYILKPVSAYDFSMKFHRTIGESSPEEGTYHKNETARNQKIKASSTDLCEVLSHYLYFHTPQKNYRSRGNVPM